jgi:hypothetical protein
MKNSAICLDFLLRQPRRSNNFEVSMGNVLFLVFINDHKEDGDKLIIKCSII